LSSGRLARFAFVRIITSVPVASWFETRIVAKFTQATYTCLRDALLTMRVRDLILRSIATRCVSKDTAIGKMH